MNYKFFKLPDNTQADAVIRTSDDGVISTIPFVDGNKDYQDYLERAETNTTEAAD